MNTGVPSSPGLPGARSSRGFGWPRDVTPAERKSLIAGGLGWMLDAMDVMLYSLVLTYLVREFGMDTRTAGFLNSLTLVASAVGGFLFGILADRIGRARALMASILVYSFASAACGFSHTIPQLATFRFVLGLGMGGEWTTGAALIAETWRAEHRGKALGLMQSAYAIGEAIAALIVLIVFPRLGWRAVFFVGVLPALLVLWIRRGVPEPDIWKNCAATQKGNWLNRLREKTILRNGLLATAMNACSMFGYWGLFTWIPGYLSLPVSRGGRGLSIVLGTTFYLVLSPGKWLGYAAITSEIFPGEIRAAAMGLSYNIGRGLSAIAPFAVGAIASRFGFGPAFFMLAAAFLAAALLALL